MYIIIVFTYILFENLTFIKPSCPPLDPALVVITAHALPKRSWTRQKKNVGRDDHGRCGGEKKIRNHLLYRTCPPTTTGLDASTKLVGFVLLFYRPCCTALVAFDGFTSRTPCGGRKICVFVPPDYAVRRRRFSFYRSERSRASVMTVAMIAVHFYTTGFSRFSKPIISKTGFFNMSRAMRTESTTLLGRPNRFRRLIGCSSGTEKYDQKFSFNAFKKKPILYSTDDHRTHKYWHEKNENIIMKLRFVTLVVHLLYSRYTQLYGDF